MLFFFNDTATTEIYTLSLHDALPIFEDVNKDGRADLTLQFERDQLVKNGDITKATTQLVVLATQQDGCRQLSGRSEEHTSELQSRQYLVCRLLLEKKKNISNQQ